MVVHGNVSTFFLSTNYYIRCAHQPAWNPREYSIPAIRSGEIEFIFCNGTFTSEDSIFHSARVWQFEWNACIAQKFIFLRLTVFNLPVLFSAFMMRLESYRPALYCEDSIDSAVRPLQRFMEPSETWIDIRICSAWYSVHFNRKCRNHWKRWTKVELPCPCINSTVVCVI